MSTVLMGAQRWGHFLINAANQNQHLHHDVSFITVNTDRTFSTHRWVLGLSIWANWVRFSRLFAVEGFTVFQGLIVNVRVWSLSKDFVVVSKVPKHTWP